MTYTKTIKLCILTESLVIVGLPVIFALGDKGILPSDISFPIAIGIAIAFVATGIYKDYGKYKQWKDIWKDPMWQTAGYIIFGLAYLVIYIRTHEFKHLEMWLFFIIANYLITDIRYYRNAIKYNLDNYDDINDAIKDHPEMVPNLECEPKVREEKEQKR